MRNGAGGDPKSGSWVVLKSDLPFKVSLKEAELLGHQQYNKKRQEIQVMRKVRFRLQKGKIYVLEKPHEQLGEKLFKNLKRTTNNIKTMRVAAQKGRMRKGKQQNEWYIMIKREVKMVGNRIRIKRNDGVSMTNYEILYKKYLDKKSWVEAKNVLLKWLEENPNSTYIQGQIAYILWEMKHFDKAFTFSSKAIALDHIEPLNLWIHSLILENLGFINQAFNIWDFLLDRPANVIGEIDCGEGEDWAKGLQADCLYKMSAYCLKLDELDECSTYLRMLKNRIKKGAFSIFNDEEIKELSNDLKAKLKAKRKTAP